MDKTINSKIISLRKDIIDRTFKNLNNKQKQAVFNTDGTLLILAGAGSGKTTVIINRIANIIKYGNAYFCNDLFHNITNDEINLMEKFKTGKLDCLPEDLINKLAVSPCKPWQILAITFTNKAAGELKNRLHNMLGDTAYDIWSSTFHSACSKILRRFGNNLGYTRNFTVYDIDDVKRLIKECLKELNIDDKFISFSSIMSQISYAKNNLLTVDDYKIEASGDFRKEKIAEIYKLYQIKLKRTDAMDFDDLLFNTVTLLKTNKDILDLYQNQFRYVLVDEYQDTNMVQYEFIKLIAGKYNNLCVVGDDDQSIYKFRGATIKNILNFEDTYKNTKVIRLEQNYRSTKKILEAANHVISNNSNRKDKTLWTENCDGEKICTCTTSDERTEALFISDIISKGVKEGKKYSDYAILYRMNSQSNSIEKALAKANIPYRIIGGHKFYERMEIRDLIAYMSVINNPNDNVRLGRIINKPKRSIGDRTIAQLNEIAIEENKPIIEILRNADKYELLNRSCVKLKQFADMLDDLIKVSNDENSTLKDLYDEIIKRTSYLDYLLIDKESGDTRVENTRELASNILAYQEENNDASLSNFLEEISLMTDVDNYDENSNAVVMMTMHSSKGLEFPTVFLPGFEETIFPSMQSIGDDQQLEEERRLAYVAMTRAKECLFILNVQMRMLFGSTSFNKPSRFLFEIPDHLKNNIQNFKCIKSTNKNNLHKHILLQNIQKFNKPKKLNNDTIYSLGDKVFHNMFGEGIVLSVNEMGNDALLEIDFESTGKKS